MTKTAKDKSPYLHLLFLWRSKWNIVMSKM